MTENNDDLTSVSKETPVSIEINGISQAVMLATDVDLEAFAIGFIYSERVINRFDEIRDLVLEHFQYQPDNESNAINAIRIDIQVSPQAFHSFKERRHFRTGATGCGLCGKAALSEALPKLTPLQANPLPSEELITYLAEQLAVNQRVSEAIGGGIHGALLASDSGEILACMEDVGRHNALDKVIGFGLKQGIDLTRCIVVMSSRCSVELIQKSVRAGIANLVHLSSPSELAIQMANQYNLNVIQSVRGGGVIVHNGQYLTQPSERTL